MGEQPGHPLPKFDQDVYVEEIIEKPEMNIMQA